MKAQPLFQLTNRIMFFFGLLALITLLYNMAAIQVFYTEFFLETNTIGLKGSVVLASFLIITLFFAISLIIKIAYSVTLNNFRLIDIIIQVFCALCLIGVLAEKVMIDEIGREAKMGWEVSGEWTILYILLCVQLLYSLYLTLSYHKINSQHFISLEQTNARK